MKREIFDALREVSEEFGFDNFRYGISTYRGEVPHWVGRPALEMTRISDNYRFWHLVIDDEVQEGIARATITAWRGLMEEVARTETQPQ